MLQPRASNAGVDAGAWVALAATQRLLLTPASAVLIGGALDALAAAAATAAPAPAAAAQPVLLRAQYTSGVVCVAPLQSPTDAAAAAGGAGAAADADADVDAAPLLAAKAGLACNRLLLLGCESGAGALRVRDARCLALLRGGGGGGADVPPGHFACELDALLSWLRESLGRFRASLPADAAGAASPTVVATLRLPAAGGAAQCAVDAFAAGAPGAPPLIAPPHVLRGLFAAAAPAGAAAAAAAPVAGSKRPREGAGGPPGAAPAASAAAPAAAAGGVSLAVIVPYRAQAAQNRAAQLARFAAHMPPFLAAAGLADFHVIVVEQSDDGLKFNRGKLLNAGFVLATEPARRGGGAAADLLRAAGAGGRFSAFCFHDVDLLPQAALAPWYARPPAPAPVHIAGAWPRYAAGNANYIGGITTLSGAQFVAVNGFPNNFWGWGGEDDELRERLQAAGLFPPARPPAALAGAIVDVEEQLAREVGGERASTKLADGGRAEWRCMWKKELRAYHARTGHANGLRTLRFDVAGARALGARVTVVTVDLLGAVDVAAQLDDAAAGVTASRATTEWLVDELLRRETAPGSGESALAAARAQYGGGQAAAAVPAAAAAAAAAAGPQQQL